MYKIFNKKRKKEKDYVKIKYRQYKNNKYVLKYNI